MLAAAAQTGALYELNSLLEEAGHTPEPNLSPAFQKAYSEGLISEDERDFCATLNTSANAAKHEWGEAY